MASIFDTLLVRAAYENVSFPVADAKTDGGNEIVEHQAYRRPGADLEFAGNLPTRGSLVVPLYNGLAGWGDLFPGTYFDLLTAIKGTPIGRLSHPTRGVFTAGIKSVTEMLSPEHRNGVTLTLEWVEYNGEASLLVADANGADATSATSAQATTADAAMAKVDPTGLLLVPMAALFSVQLAALLTGTLTYVETSAALTVMLNAVTANLASPALTAFTAYNAAAVHDAVAQLQALRTLVYQLRAQYLPGLSTAQAYTTPRTMSAAEVAVAVYGDLSKAGLVRAANSLSDYGAIPAGTVLTILPVS